MYPIYSLCILIPVSSNSWFFIKCTLYWEKYRNL